MYYGCSSSAKQLETKIVIYLQNSINKTSKKAQKQKQVDLEQIWRKSTPFQGFHPLFLQFLVLIYLTFKLNAIIQSILFNFFFCCTPITRSQIWGKEK